MKEGDVWINTSNQSIGYTYVTQQYLDEYGITPIIVDPWASERDAMHEYGVTLTKLEDVKDADCIIAAVAHDEFKVLSLDAIKALYRADLSDKEKVLLDVKGIYSISDVKASGMRLWRL